MLLGLTEPTGGSAYIDGKDCARQAFDEAAAAITGKRDLKIPAGSFPAYFLRIKYSSTGKA